MQHPALRHGWMMVAAVLAGSWPGCASSPAPTLTGAGDEPPGRLEMTSPATDESDADSDSGSDTDSASDSASASDTDSDSVAASGSGADSGYRSEAGSGSAAASVAEATTRAAPAYDLDADLTRREHIARDALGRDVHLKRVEGIFLLVGAPSMKQRGFDRAVRLVRRTVAAYLNDRFAALPERAVSVYLFPRKRPYQAYCREHYDGCGTPYGVYYHGDRRIVMNIGPGSGTLTHELVHPILESDFPTAPTWIDEGIASLFERPVFPRPGEIHGRKNWRYPRLAQALRSRGERNLVTLDRLIGLSDRIFRGGNEDLYYAMARYVCQWLDSQDLLWPFYQRWRDNAATDPTGEQAFRAVVGKTPAEANADWVRWVERL